MTTVRRADRWPIVLVRGDAAPPPGAIAARTTPEGWLRVDGAINRCGVQEYGDGERTWGELRTADEVGAPEVVAGWSALPVCDDHPPVWLDSSNAAAHTRGAVGATRFDTSTEHTLANVLVTDAAVIAKIRDGKTELSCGYEATIVPDEGVLDGQQYAYRQTKIRPNHVAIVDAARGGPTCALIFDAVHMPREEQPMTDKTKQAARTADTKTPPKPKRDAMLNIGGIDYEVPEEVAAAFAALQGDEDKPEGEMPPPPEDKPADAAPKSDAMQAQLDALRGQLERERTTADARLDARLDLVASARQQIGDAYDHRGKTTAQIHADVLAKIAPWIETKGRSDEYLAAAYDAALGATRNADSLTTRIGRATADASRADDIGSIFAQNVLGLAPSKGA